MHCGVISFAFPISVRRSRRSALGRIALEVVILGLAALMLWRNWRVGTITMITWRCEYRGLLFLWPVACFVWWVSAVSSLYRMARKVDVFRASDGAPMSWRSLVLMGYPAMEEQDHSPTMSPSIDATYHADGKPNAATRVQASPIPLTLPPYDDGGEDDTIIVRVELPSEGHLRWWNTAMQAVAMGIYLYATFVLSSVMFLTGQEAILYAVCMVLSLSAIRILTALL